MSNYNLDLLLDVESAHKKILDVIETGSTVLEVGTSHGHMTEYLKNVIGCNVTGVEIDSASLKKASRYTDFSLNLDLDNLIALDASLHNNFYDYIIVADVIEHVKYTKDILCILKDKVKDSGLILISVPNASHNLNLMQLLKNDYQYQSVGMFDNTHIRLFTSDSFMRYVKDAGLFLVHHDFTYMTPIYESCTHNSYDEFSLMEKEVLLRHKNGHFFQNIFHLSKEESKNEGEVGVLNIDAYWYDEIKVESKGKEFVKNVFDKYVELESIMEGKVYISPTMRMRGVKDLSVIVNDIHLDVNCTELYLIDGVNFSFGNGIFCFDVGDSSTNVKISFEYVDIDEEMIKFFFERLSKS